MAELIKSQLEQIGIELTINKISDEQYKEYIANKNYQILFTGVYNAYSPDLTYYFAEGNLENLLNDIKAIQDDKPKINDYLLQKEKARNDALAKKLERDIKALEAEIANLQIEFQNPDICSDFKKLMEIETEIVNRQTKIDNLTERWFELTTPEDSTETTEDEG
mgnify:CR=1 FL=1